MSEWREGGKDGLVDERMDGRMDRWTNKLKLTPIQDRGVRGESKI